jgi:putative flippase GtrA
VDAHQAEHVLFRFLRYSVVGVSMFVADLLFVAVLLFAFHVEYLPATIIGFILAMIGAFFLNRAWTFEKHTKVWRVVFAIAIAGVSLAIVSWCTWFGVEYFAMHYLTARTIGAVLATVWSYIADSLVTFQVKPFE